MDRGPLPEELVEKVTAQLGGAEEGPLYDIHDLYVERTAAELQRYMNGDVVPDRKTEETVAQKVSRANTATEDDVPDSVVGKAPAKPTVAKTTTAAPSAAEAAAPAGGGVNIAAELERLKNLQAEG